MEVDVVYFPTRKYIKKIYRNLFSQSRFEENINFSIKFLFKNKSMIPSTVSNIIRNL